MLRPPPRSYPTDTLFPDTPPCRANDQNGSYLAERLLEKGYDVIGVARRSSTVTFERIAHLQDDIEIVFGDLLVQYSMIKLLEDHQPAEVYNLAAQSFVPPSFDQPVLTGEITALGVPRVIDALRAVEDR